MTRESKKYWLTLVIGLAWFLLLLWPLLGINDDGTLSFAPAFAVWIRVAVVVSVLAGVYFAKKQGWLDQVLDPASRAAGEVRKVLAAPPLWIYILLGAALAFAFPWITSRYAQDIAVSVLIYISLGLGLNVVVGLCGLLDLGFIAFYGVGAYTYALMSIHYGLSFWLCLPVAATFAAIAGCFIGYPTLRMRGDYLAIVTLGFGEIIRIILNNWMSLTNGPNGLLGIDAPAMLVPDFADGFSLELLFLKKLHYLYYVALGLAIISIIGVHRLNFSRIGRAWEAIREDETAAELMGVNTFRFKLLAYAMGAVFGGLAGAFFSARMRFVSPESFTFIESALVLSMVVL
ncbi:MAG: ABC transporter permease subunit, partial [Oceanidesulfovibrio sp.]